LYEYAVIRFLPKVEREEFVNIGVIILCKNARFLKMKYTLNSQKIAALCANSDLDELAESMHSMQNICDGNKQGGPIAQEDAASRFRWLTAVRSAVIQTSRPHQGFSNNLDDTLLRLFTELVL